MSQAAEDTENDLAAQGSARGRTRNQKKKGPANWPGPADFGSAAI
jgi:hypothetical protein